MKRQKRRKSQYVRELERDRKRCEARHPIWHGLRCEREATEHPIHTAEDRTFEWLDVRFDS